MNAGTMSKISVVYMKLTLVSDYDDGYARHITWDYHINSITRPSVIEYNRVRTFTKNGARLEIWVKNGTSYKPDDIFLRSHIDKSGHPLLIKFREGEL